MCEVVCLNREVREKMKNIYPKDIPEEYFEAYQEMVKQYVLETKEQHKVRRMGIVGFEGIHDIIEGTFLDAIMVRPDFVKCFTA